MALIILAAPATSYAGAWNLDRNTGQVIVTGAFSSGNSFVNNDGSRQPAEFSKTETQVYFEHGVTPKWTLIGASALQMLGFQSADSSFNFDDFDDTQIGLRYQVKRKTGLAASLQASYIIDGGPPDNITDIGGSRDALELRGLWGQSYETENYGDVFFDAQIAGRLRTDGDYDSTRADLTFGYKPTPKWFVFVQNFSTFRPSETSMGFTAERQIQVKSNVSLGHEYKRNRIVQIGYTDTILARNIVKENGFFISTWLKY